MLSQLVDDLYELSLADVGALTYRKSECAVDQLLHDCVAMFRERCAAHPLRLELQLPEQPLRAQADAKRLSQLFSNLLENALRYTDAGGRVFSTESVALQVLEPDTR